MQVKGAPRPGTHDDPAGRKAHLLTDLFVGPSSGVEPGKDPYPTGIGLSGQCAVAVDPWDATAPNKGTDTQRSHEKESFSVISSN
jgi:hypothetical protein